VPECVAQPCQFSRIARHVRDGVLRGDADLVAGMQVQHLGSGSHGLIMAQQSHRVRCIGRTMLSAGGVERDADEAQDSLQAGRPGIGRWQ
jgi:hypothetical protein